MPLTVLRSIILAAALLSVACIPTGRTSIPPEESHHERTLQHQLGRTVAFQKVELGLKKSFKDLPKVLESKDPKGGKLQLKPTVSYMTGGPMGEANHARYTLAIVVTDAKVDLTFDLGPDEASGKWAPSDAIPYIRHDFDAVVTNVEEALVAR